MPNGPVSVEVKTTPPDLLDRMEGYSTKLDRMMRDHAQKVKKIVKSYVRPNIYPPVHSITGYVRTYKLGRSLGEFGRTKADVERVNRIGKGQYEVEIGSYVDYAKWVMGDDTQAWMHQGYWATMQDIADAAEPEVIESGEQLTEDVVAWLNGHG